MQINIPPMDVGQVIREIRKARKATLEEVAFAAETNASNLSRIERGVQGYSTETLERIAVALDVTVSDLYLRTEAEANSAGKSVRSSGNKNRQVPPVTFAADRYLTLTPGNRELVDEFIALLLRRQRPGK